MEEWRCQKGCFLSGEGYGGGKAASHGREEDLLRVRRVLFLPLFYDNLSQRSDRVTMKSE